MVTTDTTKGLLEAVERIRPVIEEHAPNAEANRSLPNPVYEAMFDAGLFAMLAPTAYGGLEMHPVEAMRVWEAVARIDSAAAWNLVINGTTPGFAAWLPAEGAEELFGDGPTTAAGGFYPPGRATRVEGGWRITGQVAFTSGCDNARWLFMPAVEMDGDEQQSSSLAPRPRSSTRGTRSACEAPVRLISR